MMTKRSNNRLRLGIWLLAAIIAFVPTQFAFGEAKPPEPASLDADEVEYNTETGVVTATGNVLMKRGISRVAGAKAVYFSKTQEGFVEGNVVAVREKMRMTCAKITTDGQDHMLATGNVVATQEDKTFKGEHIDYFPNQNEYVQVPNGGVATSNDGTFTADYLEGWLGEEHYVGIGNAHVVSPPRNLEAGGDRVDYYAKEKGKAILTGNAWAIQENNTVRANRITIYLADDGQAKVQ